MKEECIKIKLAHKKINITNVNKMIHNGKKKAKEEWLDEQCKKAEYLKRGRSDLAYLEI